MKRAISLILAFTMLFALVACSKQEENHTEDAKPVETSSNETTAATAVPTIAPTEPIASTQSTTEAVTQAPTQEPTQAPTQKPTQTPTQKPTQAPTQKPTQAPTQIPTQTPTQVPTQKITVPTTNPTINPTAPTVTETNPPATQEAEGISAAQAQSIAEELIWTYHQYSSIGICCEIEYIDADMSNYLSAAQKENYWNQQYKLKCCHSVSDAKAHALSIMEDNLAANFSDEIFFYDGSGNLYIIVVPMGVMGYGAISVIEYSADRIIAEAPLQDIDGYVGISDMFVIVKVGGRYLITNIYR